MNFFYSRIEKFVLGRIERCDYPDVQSYLENRKRDFNVQSIRKNLDTLDNNIAILLTHVSAMIAATGILLIVFESESTTQFFVLIEMLGYCISTLFLVINLPYSRPVPVVRLEGDSENHTDLQNIKRYYRIYLYRRFMYVKTTHFVLFLTICFSLTVVFHIGYLIVSKIL